MSESRLYAQLHREAKEERDTEARALEETIREHPMFKELQADAARVRGALDRIRARVEASPSAWLKRELRACLQEERDVVLTATLTGVRVGDHDFVEGLSVTVPVADADRLIAAGLAKETDRD